MSFINVEKGFELKGVKIGEIIDGGMVVGIDDDREVPAYDIAILRDEQMEEISMNAVCNEDIYGLEEYRDSENIEWISSKNLI